MENASPVTVAHQTMRYEKTAIQRILPINVIAKNFLLSGFLVQGLLYRWTEHSILPMTTGGGNQCLIMLHKHTLKKYLFRHAKGNSVINFYIINALGQNLANSEFCPILRLL